MKNTIATILLTTGIILILTMAFYHFTNDHPTSMQVLKDKWYFLAGGLILAFLGMKLIMRN